MDKRIKKDIKDLEDINYIFYQKGIIPFKKGHKREKRIAKLEKQLLSDDKRYDKIYA